MWCMRPGDARLAGPEPLPRFRRAAAGFALLGLLYTIAEEKASKIEGKTNGITVLGRGLTVSDGKAVPAGEIIDKNV